MLRCAVVRAAFSVAVGLPVMTAVAEDLTLRSSAAGPLYMQAESPHEIPAVQKTGATAPPESDPNTGGLTLTGGIDYTTAYFFRGYNQEDTGLILQPWLTLTANVVQNDDVTINAYITTWNSVHEEKTLSGATGPSAWYESDFCVGVDAIFGKWTVGSVYTLYTYPGGAFESIQEIGFKVAYDDTDFSQDAIGFALKPYAGIYFEFDDGNGTQDTYGEVGVAPSFALNDVYEGLVVAVPARLGLSVDDFYLDDEGDNEALGYGSIGLYASIPLPIGERYGAWTLTGGVEYIYLFADSAELANDGGENDELLGKVGISFAY